MLKSQLFSNNKQLVMKKKKLPVFRFTLSNQLGIALIAEGIIFDSNGNLIEETKKYDLAKDCNGNHIYPSASQNAKMKATVKSSR